MNDLYWLIVQERAVQYTHRSQQPGADLYSGVPVLAAHAAEFTPFHIVHIANCAWR